MALVFVIPMVLNNPSKPDSIILQVIQILMISIFAVLFLYSGAYIVAILLSR